ncbi:MAG: hypothetical protein DSM106950_13425 [Stigonema ocellatum SAG 48.90 = DSM 106950]|nr:hypothetical protein [Stigonema ocellatum SAG 48.90 = DSM 106950]
MLVKVYPRNQRIEHDDLINPQSFSTENPQELVGTYCHKEKVLYQTQTEIKFRRYKTPHLIKEVELINRSSDTEEIFGIEESKHFPVVKAGEISQILNLYCVFDTEPHSDEELIIHEYIDQIGTFFSVDYENSLEKLIAIQVWNGWTRQETMESIGKLLKLTPGFGLEDLEWLRQTMNLNSEPNNSQAA